ncbi:Transposase domain [Halomonas sp. hl-4]|nr:transposase [Halomonas sp. hl-4]SNY97599.1 Transposase domain [Halomonas sp. hl-4]
MPRFKAYKNDQNAMVVINCQDQLQPGTFEHAVHYLIEHKFDLSVFHPKYRNDAAGRLAYAPAILLKIILFAYSKGITSCRKMQWSCCYRPRLCENSLAVQKMAPIRETWGSFAMDMTQN